MVITNLRKYHQLINLIFPNSKPFTLHSHFKQIMQFKIHSEPSLKEQDELWEIDSLIVQSNSLTLKISSRLKDFHQ